VSRIWTCMPFVDLWDAYTCAAAEDVLAQEGVAVRLLLVSNGSGTEDRAAAEQWAAGHWPRVLLWHHAPPLPGLGATWNWGCQFAFEGGADVAWVVNNDVRLAPRTLDLLLRGLERYDGMFASAVGVREQQMEQEQERQEELPAGRGGPDYSCFLVTREGWEKYPFDPFLTYCGDVDHHRRMILGGDGARIYSVDVPYLHFGSRTINRSEEALAEHHRTNGQHHAYYTKKWGGFVNAERWAREFDPDSARDGVATPELFEQVREEWSR
jgi:hypothetical protein